MNNNIISVPFHSQMLSVVLVNDLPFVAMKPICEAIGIDWEGQRQKINRHSVLSQVACMIKATSFGQDGKEYIVEMMMLPIKYLNGWLFGIDANRVKAEAKDLVIEYQRECFDVLADHFMPKPQYGLKQLPPSPYISEPEAAQFMKSIQAHCKSSGGKYSALYKKVYDYYGITSYKHIPAGKLEEAARLCGMKLMKLVKSKIPDEIPLLTFTQDELDTLIAERVKAIEGEVMSKEQTIANSDLVNILTGRVKALESELSALKEDLRPNITGDLNPSGKQRPLWLYSITDAGHQRYQPIDSDCLCMTEEHFIRHLKNSGRVVFDKTGVSARQIVMHHIPPQFLPDMIEEAGAMLRRINEGKLQA